MALIESTEGHYEVQDGELGKTYRWCLDCVLVECDCGETTTLTSSETTCAWCGADHASAVQDELAAQWLEDEAV